MLLVLTGCQAKVSLPDVLNEVKTEYGLNDMTDIADKDELYRYYVIEQDDVVQFSAAVQENGTEDHAELVIIQAADSESADMIAAKLYSHLQSRLSNAQDYAPDAAAVLEQSVALSDREYAILVIAPEADSVYRSICNHL